MNDVVRITAKYELPMERMRMLVTRLLEGGPDYLGDYDRGLGFWMEVWDAMRLEERLVPLEDLIDTAFPPGLDLAKLEEILADAPSDLRFPSRLPAGTGYLRNRLEPVPAGVSWSG
jgi:hypothetical protein